MINTKADLKTYLVADSKGYQNVIYDFSLDGIKKYIFRLLGCNPGGDQRMIWNYIYCLRHAEFAINNCKWTRVYWLWRLRKLSYKLGYQIPPNVFGKGLTIYHWGSVIINADARVGENTILQPQIVIGQKRPGESPIIGNGCNICAGARIIGKVKIGNNVTVAPNAVVVKDVPDNCVVAGVPAKIVKYKNE